VPRPAPRPVARRGLPAIGCAVALALVAAGCGGGHKSAAASRTPTSPPATTTDTPAPATGSPTHAHGPVLSPLTGKRGGVGKPVLAVKIENTANGRPQVNVNSADVVYVEQVEGGLTRLMAIYNSTIPSVVGPVRSARESDVELLKQYGHVGLAFSGAQHKVLPIIDNGSLIDLSPDHDSVPYYRDHSRPAPYNLFLRPGQLIGRHKSIAKVRDVGFRFGFPSPGGRAAHRVTLAMSSSVTFTFTYDAKRHGYDEAMSGTPIIASSGSPQWTNNVLVQTCDVHRSRFHDFLGNYTPLTVTVGSGRFFLFRDGKEWAGTWSRPKANGPTHYRLASGKDVRLKPGRTWVLLKGKGLPITAS
jgi:hypothetical protein